MSLVRADGSVVISEQRGVEAGDTVDVRAIPVPWRKLEVRQWQSEA